MKTINAQTLLRSSPLMVGLVWLSACSGPDKVANENPQQNTAQIAADAAQMSADQMHNEMSREGMGRQAKDGQTMGMDGDHMGMGKMKSGAGMSDDNMAPMGGNDASNMQAMPQNQTDAPMPMKDDM